MLAHADIDRVELATLNLAEDITSQVKGISPNVLGYGGSSEIRTAVWHSPYGDMKVAVKVIRSLPTTQVGDEMPRVLRHEIAVWKKLLHRNIHILCGLYNGIGPIPALVSPWCENGDINAYLRSPGDRNIEVLKLTLLMDVLSGLKFLHANGIVHGDIKGANVLISDEGVARLCDFGLSRILAEHSQSSTHSSTKGTSRWMAPELLAEGVRASYLSDLWACGCLLIEIWSAVKPYHTKTYEHQVIAALLRQETPARPNDMSDYVWSLITACCVVDPLWRRNLLQLIAQVNFDLVSLRLKDLITMGRPLDDATSDVLDSVIHSLRGAADPAVGGVLYTLGDSDLAVRVLRDFSSWGLDNITSGGLFRAEVYLWCLSAINDPASDSRSPSVSNGGPTALDSRDDMDEDEQSEQRSRNDTQEDERLPPHILRPVARLLAAVNPALAERFMRRFASATLFSIPSKSELYIQEWDGEGDYYVARALTPAVWLPGDSRIALPLFLRPSDRAVVRIWDIAAQTIVYDLIGHTSAVTDIAVSPSGRLLASCSYDRSVRLWDVETGRDVGTPMLEHASDLFCVAFSPDGLCIASGDEDGTVRVWRTATQKSALKVKPFIGHEERVNDVAYSSDGSRIVSCSYDGSVRLWDASTGDCTRVLRPGTGPIRSVVFSPDSSKMVSGSFRNALHIWNAVTGDEAAKVLVEGYVFAVACSPNGSRIASGTSGELLSMVQIRDAADGSLITEPLTLRYNHMMYSLQFSLDGSRLLSSAEDGVVRILDATEDWKRWDI